MKDFEIFRQKGLHKEYINPHMGNQFLIDENHNEHIDFFISISDIVLKEELVSTKREITNKTIEYIKELIEENKSLINSGVKFKFLQYYKGSAYEKWEDGYIEFYISVSTKHCIDYFIWCYAKMEHLEKVYNRFKPIFD